MVPAVVTARWCERVLKVSPAFLSRRVARRRRLRLRGRETWAQVGRRLQGAMTQDDRLSPPASSVRGPADDRAARIDSLSLIGRN